MRKRRLRGQMGCIVLSAVLLAGIPANAEASETAGGQGQSGTEETEHEKEVSVDSPVEPNAVINLTDSDYMIAFEGGETYTYTAEEIKPVINVYEVSDIEKTSPLSADSYDVTYNHHINAGTSAEVKVTGKDGKASGTLQASFTILPANMNACTVQLSQTSYTYDGTEKKPDVTVKLGNHALSQGTDFTVSYTGNVQAGRARVIVTAAGDNFTGSTQADFTITAPAPANPSPQPEPPRPEIKNGLTAPTIQSAVYSAKGKKKITIKWTKVEGAKGYYVYRGTSANGKYKKVKTISSGKTLSWKDTGIKKQKTYYYKVTAYKKVKKKKVSGPDSAYCSCTTTDTGFASSGYTIYINKKTNVVTVYDSSGTAVKAFVCSTGKATPTGTFYTKAKYRWHKLMGNCYGQWDTRIVGGVLFHSVYYLRKNNNQTLSVKAYNKLGTTASHGCVRLTARDAKWIYDNCKLKTKVVIVKKSNGDPLGKPQAFKLPKWHTWDPTDPNCTAKCKEKGCH